MRTFHRWPPAIRGRLLPAADVAWASRMASAAMALLLLASPAHAELNLTVPADVRLTVTEPARPIKIGMSRPVLVAALAGQAFDLTTSLVATRHPALVEGNGLGLRGVVIIKAALFAAPWLVQKLRIKREGADVVGYAMAVGGAVPGAINVRTLRRAQRLTAPAALPSP